MKFLILVGMLCISITIRLSAQSDEMDAPYIYYYSSVLRGLVVERADGTDSRVLGEGMVTENITGLVGPGWSADGTWFAWHVETIGGIFTKVAKGYAVNTDGQRNLELLLEDFSCVFAMEWHPSKNILLVYGEVEQLGECDQEPRPTSTYWLIDADNQTVLASVSINQDYGSSPLVKWDEGRELIQFIGVTSFRLDNTYDTKYNLVTMNFNGLVELRPVTLELVSEFEDEFVTEFDDDMIQIDPSSATYFESVLDNDVMRDLLWSPRFVPAIKYDGGNVTFQWHESKEWILVGHEACRVDCSYITGAVSIHNMATDMSREISDCGGHPTCVGWLPDNINIEQLTEGRDMSVLPSPLSIEYTDEPSYSGFLSNIYTHEIVCNSADKPTLVNRETGGVDFTLVQYKGCALLDPFSAANYGMNANQNADKRYPVVFAISPDQKYYALTDSSYTSLYSVDTGDRIVTLNFYGESIEFSDDSRYLTTSSTTATAIWDIADLVENYSVISK